MIPTTHLLLTTPTILRWASRKTILKFCLQSGIKIKTITKRTRFPDQHLFFPTAWQGWGFHHPTENFAEEFEPNDTIRKRATLISVGDSLPNQTNLVTIGAGDAYQMFAGKEGQSTGRLLPSMVHYRIFYKKIYCLLAR